jgi:anti-sigma B factor antagonist
MSQQQLNTGTEMVPSARQEGGAVIAAVRGEIDLHNSPELRTAMLDVLLRSEPKKLVLNLAEVPYMDSSAIAVLVESLQKLRRYGGRIFLTNLQPRVKGLLEIARLDTIFIVTSDEAEALAK